MAPTGTWSAVVNAFWAWVYVESHKRRPSPPKPGKPRARQVDPTSGDLMALTYQLQLPPNTAADVVSSKLYLTVTEAGGEPVEQVIPEVPDGYTFTVADNASVLIQVSQIDDAGNESEKSDPIAFNAQDTLPPAKPGQPGVVLIGEA